MVRYINPCPLERQIHNNMNYRTLLICSKAFIQTFWHGWSNKLFFCVALQPYWRNSFAEVGVTLCDLHYVELWCLVTYGHCMLACRCFVCVSGRPHLCFAPVFLAFGFGLSLFAMHPCFQFYLIFMKLKQNSCHVRNAMICSSSCSTPWYIMLWFLSQ